MSCSGTPEFLTNDKHDLNVRIVNGSPLPDGEAA